MKQLLFLLIVTAISISGCNSVEALMPQNTPPANPQADRATVIGRLLDAQTGDPLVDKIGRLADVIREDEGGYFILDLYRSPGAWVDANGYIIFENIPAQEYVLSIGYGEDYADYVAVKNSDGTAKVWNATPGQILDMGTIRINLTPMPITSSPP